MSPCTTRRLDTQNWGLKFLGRKEKWLVSKATLKRIETFRCNNEGVVGTFSHLRHLRTLSRSWLARSVWPLVWGWNPEERLTVTPISLQNSFQNRHKLMTLRERDHLALHALSRLADFKYTRFLWSVHTRKGTSEPSSQWCHSSRASLTGLCAMFWIKFH